MFVPKKFKKIETKVLSWLIRVQCMGSTEFFPRNYFRGIFSAEFFPQNFFRGIFSAEFSPQNYFRDFGDQKEKSMKSLWFQIKNFATFTLIFRLCQNSGQGYIFLEEDMKISKHANFQIFLDDLEWFYWVVQKKMSRSK